MDDIRQGVSKLRNRVIARVFRELDLIEQWGSGIRRIFEEAQQLGLPEPHMVEIGMRVRFIVFLKEAVSVTTTEVNAEVKSVIEHLDRELTRKELQEKLGLKHDEYFRKAYLLPALESGCIEMTIPDKPNSRLQKYRLTIKGKNFHAVQVGGK
jgi:ATP-dependent DNA helicase RecG